MTPCCWCFPLQLEGRDYLQEEAANCNRHQQCRKTSNPTTLRHISIGQRMAVQLWRTFRVGSLHVVGVNTNTTDFMEVTSDVKQHGTEQSDVGVYIRWV